MDSSSSRTKCITERLKTSQRQGREYRVSPSRTKARRLLVTNSAFNWAENLEVHPKVAQLF